MKRRIKLKGHIKSFIHISLYLGVLLLVVDAAMFMVDLRAGLLLSGYTILYFAITLYLYFFNKPLIMNELVSFATEYGQIQKKLLREMDLPYALLDDTGKVIHGKGPTLGNYDPYVIDVWKQYYPEPVEIKHDSVLDHYDIHEEIGT